MPCRIDLAAAGLEDRNNTIPTTTHRKVDTQGLEAGVCAGWRDCRGAGHRTFATHG